MLLKIKRTAWNIGRLRVVNLSIEITQKIMVLIKYMKFTIRFSIVSFFMFMLLFLENS